MVSSEARHHQSESELVLRDRRRVRIRKDVDGETLHAVLAAVEGPVYNALEKGEGLINSAVYPEFLRRRRKRTPYGTFTIAKGSRRFLPVNC
jgi:hypothetical protein